MAMTIRLPEQLKADAETYAAGLGLSLNALLAVALRDYLDARSRPRTRSSAPPAPATVAGPSVAPSPSGKPEGAALSGLYTVASRSDPCPCGARDAKGFRVKFKHCHGKLRD